MEQNDGIRKTVLNNCWVRPQLYGFVILFQMVQTFEQEPHAFQVLEKGSWRLNKCTVTISAILGRLCLSCHNGDKGEQALFALESPGALHAKMLAGVGM